MASAYLEGLGLDDPQTTGTDVSWWRWGLGVWLPMFCEAGSGACFGLFCESCESCESRRVEVIVVVR